MMQDTEKLNMRFEEIYEKEIEPKVKEIEEERLSIIDAYHKYTKLSFLTLLSMVFLFIGFAFKYKFCFIIWLFMLVTGIFYVVKAGKIQIAFREKLKSELLKPILNVFGNFEITDTETISLKDIKELGLFGYSQEKSDNDVIIGQYEEIPVELTETSITHEEKDSEGNSRTITDFNGLISIFSLINYFKFDEKTGL